MTRWDFFGHQTSCSRLIQSAIRRPLGCLSPPPLTPQRDVLPFRIVEPWLPNSPNQKTDKSFYVVWHLFCGSEHSCWVKRLLVVGRPAKAKAESVFFKKQITTAGSFGASGRRRARVPERVAEVYCWGERPGDCPLCGGEHKWRFHGNPQD